MFTKNYTPKTSDLHFLNIKKLGVTLLELLIALSILWFGLMSIINMLNGGLDNVDRMRQEVIAINLAREWVEWVYNVRNTNRIKRAWVKDKCRLKVDPFSSNQNCWDDERMQKKNYIIDNKTKAWQQYYFLSWLSVTWLDISTYDAWIDDQYSLCYSWQVRTPCPGKMESRSEGRFFRSIEWKWLFLKDVKTDWWDFFTCTKWNDSWCSDKRAKEFRFCSKVQYLKKYLWTIEFCATLNNFQD